MYNNNELQAVALSPTKKDYYQIWTELIDVAKKLSTRWDPSATNESDPGIVLLKVLTAIADKLNYNIDANTLEAFMPSAAQESSMRKLCEMLGYTMQYFKSATTTVRIHYRGNSFPAQTNTIQIPKFTNIKDKNSKYNYITLDNISLTREYPSATVDCIEGELVTCQTENGNIVTSLHLDDNNRFYLPEQQVASNDNCVFISRADRPLDFWKSTDNLNTCLLGTSVYKFGFDSSRGLPYVQFPDDIGSLIGPGLIISFIRTQGINGNISARLLQTFEKPAIWESAKEVEDDTLTGEEIVEGTTEVDTSWMDLEQYSVANLASARNGRNPETIDEAYWNYQKTIGTFDTLVTCRDYMNKIYQMTRSDIDSTPKVSNIIVSDIRDDINRAYTLCTQTNQGIEYTRQTYKKDDMDRIDHFDLVLYPFETIYGLNTKAEFESSFKYSSLSLTDITTALEDSKTIAHKFKSPDPDDIICVKVYFQYSARITTTSKVSSLEAAEVESAAHGALYKEYNLRHISFGEELPYDSILKTLTLADPRIKNVILDDPIMVVAVCLKNGNEIPIISNDYIFEDDPGYKEDSTATSDTALIKKSAQQKAEEARDYYMRLVLTNVLAGKVSLFNYDNTFNSNFTDKIYPEGKAVLSATTSLRRPTDSIENPTLVPLADIISSDKKQTFISPDLGTLFIYLKQSNLEVEASSLDDIFKGIESLGFKLYTKGSAIADYTIKFIPRKADTNDKTLSGLTVQIQQKDGELVYDSTQDDTKLQLQKLVDFGCKSDISFSEGNGIPVAEGITAKGRYFRGKPWCQIPFNLLKEVSGTASFDKVEVFASSNSLAEADTLKNASIEFVFKKFEAEWNSSEGYTIVASPKNKWQEITINLSAEPDFQESDYYLLGFWPGCTSEAAAVAPPAAVFKLVEENNNYKFQVSRINDNFNENLTFSDLVAGDCLILEEVKKTDDELIISLKLKYSAYSISSWAFLEFSINEEVITKESLPESISYDTFLDITKVDKLVKLTEDNKGLEVKDAPKLSETDIAAIATDFIIDTAPLTAEDPLILSEGEVVQFRSPNFKTTATYPAYVNYFASLKTADTSQNQEAIPATMIKLHEFFGGGAATEAVKTANDADKYFAYIPLVEKDGSWVPKESPARTKYHANTPQGRNKFWEERVNSLPAGCMKKLFTTSIATEGSAYETLQQSMVKDSVDKYHALFIKGETDNKYHLFELPKDESYSEGGKTYKYGIPDGLDIYAVDINEQNFTEFIKWLQNKSSKLLTYYDANGTAIPGRGLIQGLYSQGRSNLSRDIGKLVDVARFKYELLESLSKTGYQVLSSYYVPQLHTTKDDDHTEDGLGQDAATLGLAADTEYKLGEGEYILITYSTSEGREDGSTVVKNIMLDSGTIIKANFELIDSTKQARVAKYPKTSGYGPWKRKNGDIKKPTEVPGMFTLGANEQIEVREPIVVELNDAVANLYWELKHPRKEIWADGIERECFPFDEDGSYILQAGEYLFYTNSAKESMAYYGSGSEIKRGRNTPDLYVTAEERKISMEAANEVGLVASMPWTPFDLSGTNGGLTISEYQIINLALGDELAEVIFPEEESENTIINNKFRKVERASYKIAGNSGELSKLLLQDLSWEVRGKLELSLNSEYPQILTVHRNSVGQEIARDILSFKDQDLNDLYVITPQNNAAITEPTPVSMSVYASEPILSADGTYLFAETERRPILKLCEQASLKAISTDLNIEKTVSLVFEKDSEFASYDSALGKLDLNAILPEGDFGLLTIFVPNAGDSGTVKLTTKLTGNKTLAIFNYTPKQVEQTENSTIQDYLNSFTWWSGEQLDMIEEDANTYSYPLRAGLNTIYIPESCTLQISAKENSAPTVFLGKVYSIPSANSLNPQLAFESAQDKTALDTSLKFRYKSAISANEPVTVEAAEEPNTKKYKIKELEVLALDAYKAIRELDPDLKFFYTHIPNNVSGLDLDANDPLDTLALPQNWFDRQNLINKFVVSELDTDYLSKYIGVSKFSRSQL